MNINLLKAVRSLASSLLVSTFIVYLSPIVSVIYIFTIAQILFLILKIFGMNYQDSLHIVSMVGTVYYIVAVFIPGIIFNLKINKENPDYVRVATILIYLIIQAAITFYAIYNCKPSGGESFDQMGFTMNCTY